MIEAVPRAWYSRTIHFLDHGDLVAVLDQPVLRSGSVHVGDDVYTIRGQGVFRRSYALEGHGRLLAEATTSLIPPRFEIMAGDRNLTLRATGFTRREFRLLHGDLQVGRMRRRSLFSRAAVVDFPDTLPVPVRVFLAFLVYRFWRRRARAAG